MNDHRCSPHDYDLANPYPECDMLDGWELCTDCGELLDDGDDERFGDAPHVEADCDEDGPSYRVIARCAPCAYGETREEWDRQKVELIALGEWA